MTPLQFKKKIQNNKNEVPAPLLLDNLLISIFTSGTILASAAFLVGKLTTQPVIAILGECLVRGPLISIVPGRGKFSSTHRAFS